MTDYKKEGFYYHLANGHRKSGIAIIAKNGKKVAEAYSDTMADRIIEGLRLEKEVRIKRDQFRL